MKNASIYLLLIILLNTFNIIFSQNNVEQNNRPLNFLFYVSSFPKISEVFILNQITGLIDMGHNVTILAEHGQAEALTHDSIAQYNLIKKTYYQSLPENKRNFDVILCQFGTLATPFLNYKKQYNIMGKLVVFFRGYDISRALKENPNMYHNIFKQYDLFVPICKRFKKRLIALGCNARKIQIIHSAIDCDKFKFKPRNLNPDKSIKLIAVNRLVEKKGTEYAIYAVSKLIKHYPKIQFDIVGSGPLEANLQNLINKLNAQNHIKLLGWRNHEQVLNLLDKSHIFILPSVTSRDGDEEGIPNALKEAMAMGLPVISTYHSAIPELIENNKSGFLVPERNITDLYNKIEYVITHPDQWNTIGYNARKQVENNFNMKIENKKLVSLCRQLIKNINYFFSINGI